MTHDDREAYPETKPDGWVYVIGVCRNEPDVRKAHVYTGPSYHDLRGPLCRHGWNRLNGFGFSIFRNNSSAKGKCAVCAKREVGRRGPVPPYEHKTRWL